MNLIKIGIEITKTYNLKLYKNVELLLMKIPNYMNGKDRPFLDNLFLWLKKMSDTI